MSGGAAAERFFAPCPRGLEASLAAELGPLGAGEVATVDGGVAFAGDLALACRANLQSRLASRILWRVGGGACRDERDLYALVHALEWQRLFKAERTLRVDVSATRAPMKSLEFATLRVKDAVCDRFRAERGVRPSIDKRAPDVRVNVYLTEHDATIYVDTSGEPLFKRGYRREADEAPLRENLAAGLIALAGWAPGTPFLDPLCGSGTIAVEAALIAANRAPGLMRSFGFQKLEWYDGPAWQRMKQAARDALRPAPPTPGIFASDIAQPAVAKCAGNLAAAQVRDFVAIDRIDVLERAAPAAAGVLLANPPYGERLDDAARLAAFYPKLGDALKRRFAGWTACFLTADLRLAKLIGLKAARRTPLYNGALECRLFAFPLVAGSMREKPPVLKSP
ncbi:MAG: THUMP domain-containing protein [Betaproteobacteria bacterium]